MIIKTVGRRKCSVAVVKLIRGEGNISVNEKDLVEYFQNNPKFIRAVQAPLFVLGLEKSYDLFITSFGGGLNGQSEAIRLSISRSLYNLLDENNRKILKSSGYLTRNSSVKERRKYGLKKARKASQFSKR
uniref:Small ribosomal subunit protein uS9c n=1 Tax=Euglena mutabilis TaxID=38275 RepID=A0A1B0UL05_EUGMU|nr:ribosomal protein S9 [Euglena mutabilis]